MANITDLGNGKYRVIISNGYKANGERIRTSKTITAVNMKDAEKQAKIIEGETLRGKAESKNSVKVAVANKVYTFLEVVEKWRSLIENDDYAKKTLFRYEGILEKFLIPYFGHMNVKDISYMIVKEYMITLDVDGVRLDNKSGGYSIQTKLHHKRLIVMLLNQAVTYEWIHEIPYRENLSEIRKQKKKRNSVGAKQPIMFYTVEEINELYKILDDIEVCKIRENKTLIDLTELLSHKVFCHLGFETGLRLCEMCGLEFNDVNYKDKQIELYRTSHYTSKDGVYTQGGTKTEPFRIVSVGDDLLELLKAYEIQYKMMWEEKRRQQTARVNRINYDIKVSNRLFTKRDGTPINPSTLTAWFPRFLTDNSLKRLTDHGMRHTHASILIFSGVDILTISKRLGHATVSFTYERYGHLMPRADRNCADTINRILN